MHGRCVSLTKNVLIGQNRRLAGGFSEAKTHVILLHMGQPRTEFYAKQHLKDSAALYYNIPDKVRSFVTSPMFVGNKPRRCIEQYGDQENIDAILQTFSSTLEDSVSKVVPEFGRVQCSAAFLFGNDSIPQRLTDVIQKGADRIVLLPLYPHFHCAQTGALLNAVTEFIDKDTVPGEPTKFGAEKSRIVPNTEISFHISAIRSFGEHPVLSNYWYQNLSSLEQEYDAVLFAAPFMRGSSSSEYRHSVWASCERVMSELDFSVPWDLGFFNQWDQWPVPSTNCVSLKHRRLAGKIPFTRKVAVVPITHFFPTFDTISVLPNIVSKMERAFFVAPNESALLEQGLCELVKNHLLGRRQAQLQLLCDTCTTSQCSNTRRLFAPRKSL